MDTKYEWIGRWVLAFGSSLSVSEVKISKRHVTFARSGRWGIQSQLPVLSTVNSGEKVAKCESSHIATSSPELKSSPPTERLASDQETSPLQLWESHKSQSFCSHRFIHKSTVLASTIRPSETLRSYFALVDPQNYTYLLAHRISSDF